MNSPGDQKRDPAELGQVCHPACMVCGARSRSGLGLRFDKQPDGSVVGRFACDANYQSYPDRMHGGVVSMLLDAAMTNCLFAHRIQAVTAKLSIRFRHPVKLGMEATIQAWLVDQSPPLYVLKAELRQGDQTCALADAKFYGDASAEQASEKT